MLNYLKQICNVPSPSGREKAVADKILTIIAPMADKVWSDAMGSLIALKKGTAPDGERRKIMLCGHMDEIGFMVTSVDDKGFIRTAPIGYPNYSSAIFSTVLFESGVRGVLVPEGNVPLNALRTDNVYIDVGAKDKKEALKKVKIGDFAIIEPRIQKLCGKRYMGHPIDDKLGCAVILKIAEMLKDTECKNDVYYVFSVQEEVGMRGAGTVAFGINPDEAVAFDVTGTGDTIGCGTMECAVGNGAAVKVRDNSVICDWDMVCELTEIAKCNKIKYQTEILEMGGTDTATIQRALAGVKAGCLSIPTRYIHSQNELFDLDDAEACAELAVKYITRE